MFSVEKSRLDELTLRAWLHKDDIEALLCVPGICEVTEAELRARGITNTYLLLGESMLLVEETLCDESSRQALGNKLFAMLTKKWDLKNVGNMRGGDVKADWP